MICVCEKPFSVGPVTSCMKGGFVYQRHHDLRDRFANLLNGVCPDVQVEPHRQPLAGDEARLDGSARGFW